MITDISIKSDKFQIEQLVDFFQQQPEERCKWRAHTSYKLNDNQQYRFDFNIIKGCRKTRTGHKTVYVFYYPKAIGSGSFCVVHPLDSTYSIKQKENQFRKIKWQRVTKPTVIKIIYDDNDAKPQELAHSEYRITHKLKHLQTRKPLHNKSTSFLIQNIVLGSPLNRVNYDVFNDTLKLDVTLALLYALKKVSDKNIIHRDIKPDNIMLNLKKTVQAHLIDFNMAKFFKDRHTSIAGSWYYMAPEHREGHPATFKSDIFSMGLVLNELWNDCLYRRNDIEQGINAMLYTAPDKRCNIDEAIHYFLTIREKQLHKNLIDLSNLLNDLSNHCNSLNKRNFPELAESIANFCQSRIEQLNKIDLKQALYSPHLHNQINEFIQSSKEKIAPLYQQATAKHRDYNYLYANIALAIIGVGVFYLLAASINKYKNHKFLFFSKQATAQCLSRIDDQLETLPIKAAASA